jgi:hypothetical protein
MRSVIYSSLNTPFLTSELELGNHTEVVDLFSTFLESIYSLILVGYSGRYDFFKIAVSFVIRCRMCSMLF